MKADARVPSEAQPSLLFSREAIAARVKELAKQINHDYTGKKLLVVGILKGAFVFLADLVRELEVASEVDFIRAASYGHGTTSSGQVRLTKDLDGPIVGRHVLIIEDILPGYRSDPPRFAAAAAQPKPRFVEGLHPAQ